MTDNAQHIDAKTNARMIEDWATASRAEKSIVKAGTANAGPSQNIRACSTKISLLLQSQ
jgi:hypothetical protein